MDRQPIVLKPVTAVDIHHRKTEHERVPPQQHEKAVHLVELQPELKGPERSSPSGLLSPQKGKKSLDMFAEVDLAERRAQEEREARLQTGYRLKALAAERKAISDLRIALTKAICTILELCRPIAEVSALADERSKEVEYGWSERPAADHSRFPPHGGATGPPSALVQMVYSGEHANVRCSGDAYKLCTGLVARIPNSDHHHNFVEHCRSLPTSSSSKSSLRKPAPQKGAGITKRPSGHSCKVKQAATAVAEAGTVARTILDGFLLEDISDCAQQAGEPQPNPPPAPSPPPADLWEAISAARLAVDSVPRFYADVCNLDWDAQDDRAIARNGDIMQEDLLADDEYLGNIGGDTGRSSRVIAVGQDVETSATGKVVNALQGDTLWVQALPSFVRKTLEAQANRIGQHESLT